MSRSLRRTPAAASSTDPELPRALLVAARAQQPAMTALLQDLVTLETPSLEPQAQGPALDLVQRHLQETGLRCRRRAGRASGGLLLARWPRARGRPFQMLIGHCDTVWPRGTLEEMPVVIEGTIMRGPGVYDMKAGIVQTMAALRIVRDLGVEPAVAPVAFINSDEEIGSRDSERWLRRLARGADRALVMEPSLSPSGKLKTARKGVRQYEIRITGRAAHAGLDPERGISAILELSLIVQRLFDLNDPEAGVSVNVGTIDGGLRPNVIAPQSRANVDVRVPTNADAERVDDAIMALRPEHPDVVIEVQRAEGRAPLEPTPGSRVLWHAAERIASTLGFTLEEGRAGGGSDGNITGEYTPTLDGLGAVGDGAHALHEYVDLEHMPVRTALLAALIMEPPTRPGS